MTYSIIGRDPASGAIGVAAQSRWFNLGPQLMFVEHGVGAVATQSFVEPSYGPLGLELMRLGRSSEQALAALVSTDPGAPMRQVAMLDAAGRFAQHTGAGCVAECGSAVGEHCAAQGNMLASSDAWQRMVEAFEGTGGPLAERLVAALQAAQDTGGDGRGSQSAAILVRSGPAMLAEVDLRVADHPAPVQEIARLVQVSRAFDALDRGLDLAMQRDASALDELAEARHLAPQDDQIIFWQAAVLAAMGRHDAATATMAEARAVRPEWTAFLDRVVAAGLLPDDPAALAALRA
jgi:uncharacterized Ntn-hydrolase superfamily protein